MATTLTALRLTPSLTPHGRLVIVAPGGGPELERALGERIRQAFERGAGHGLLRLGAAEVGHVLPPFFTYWRELGGLFVTALCTRPKMDGRKVDLPPPQTLAALAAAAPPLMSIRRFAVGMECSAPRNATPGRPPDAASPPLP